MAISCSLFYGSLVLKLEVPADGRSAGASVASCKWQGWQGDDGAGVKGVLAGARGQRAEANGNTQYSSSSFLPITARLVPLSRRFGLS